MTLKYTMLFSHTSNIGFPNLIQHRTGGWSESWYFPGNDLATLVKNISGDALTTVSARAGLLPIGCAIVGVRVQTVDPVGPSQSLSIQKAGTSGLDADVPQMALLIKVPGVGVKNVRRVILRGLPDAWVTQGELNPTDDFRRAWTYFKVSLLGQVFRGRDLAAPTVKIITIDTAGKVTTEAPHTLNPLDMVRILRTKRTDGNLVGGRFQVSSVGPGTNVFTMYSWTNGATTGGAARKDGIVYPAIDTSLVDWDRVVTRRVGRAPKQYRGRQSKKTL